LTVAKDADEETVTSEALAHEHVQKFTDNKKPAKVIYVPGRLVNIVI
jgi:leucyl-tRNA synthetase